MTAGRDSGRPFPLTGPRAAAVLLLLILFVRIGFVLHSRSSILFDNSAGDVLPYRERAGEILDGNWVGDEVFFDAPLFPYFLALFGARPGGPELPVRLAHALLDTASALVVFLLTRSLFGAGPGLLAALLYGSYGFALFYDALLLKPPLATFLLLLAAWLLRRGRALSSGLLLALAVLVRGNFLLLFPAFLVPAVRRSPRRGALFLIGLSLPILLVTARNFAVGNDLVFLTYHAGPTFYHGNNPAARGTYAPILPGRQNPPYEKADAVRIAREAAGRKLRPSEINRYWFARAFAFIRANPGRFARLTLRRAHFFWNGKEIPDTFDFRLYRRFFPELALAAVPFGLLAPLALLGWFFPRRLRGEALFLPAIVLLYFLSLLFLFVFGRYRLPVVPFLAPTAGLFLYRLGHCFARGERRRGTVLLAATLLLVVAVNHGGFRAGPATGLYNMGIAFEKAGRNGDAETAYREAVEASPSFASAWNNLGGVLLAQGRKEEAARCFEEALRSDPDHALANRNLARLRREAGRYGDARALLLRAIETEKSAALLVELAATEELAGRTKEAAGHYREVLAAAPSSSVAAANLGRLLATAGDFEQAIPLLRTAAARLPSEPAPVLYLALSLVETGRAGEAAALLRGAGATAGDARASLLSARILEGEGRLDEAARALAAVRAEGLPAEPVVRLFLGEGTLLRRLVREGAFPVSPPADPR